VLALLTRWLGDKRVTLPVPRYGKTDVLFLKELVEAGHYRPVVDRSFPLEQVSRRPGMSRRARRPETSS
jgi:hypothetical protein